MVTDCVRQKDILNVSEDDSDRLLIEDWDEVRVEYLENVG